MDSKDELQSVISKILAEKTFSTEAMEAIQELDENYSAALDTIADNNKTIDRNMKDIAALTVRMSEAEMKNQHWEAKAADLEQREKSVKERELRQEVLDTSLRYEQMRVNDVKEMFQTVFRNTTLRKSITENVPVAVNKDQYGNTIYPTTMPSTKNEEVREE